MLSDNAPVGERALSAVLRKDVVAERAVFPVAIPNEVLTRQLLGRLPGAQRALNLRPHVVPVTANVPEVLKVSV